MTMFIATSLLHYKRPEVQQALVHQAMDKEVSVIFGKDKFGKRPDVLLYPQDVMEFAMKKASSFHCSEELWMNPLSIQTGMKRHELNAIRKGWDLILDVDCPDWNLSKLIAHLFIQALQDHGVTAISAKFSGNKGFHIAVPFEAFPDQVYFDDRMHKTKDLFPELPKKIALYLLSYITEHYVTFSETQVTFLHEHVFSLQDLDAIAKQTGKTLFGLRCVDCGKPRLREPEKKPVYICESCGRESHPKNNPEYIRCTYCSHPVSPFVQTVSCSFCSSVKHPERFLNFLAVVEIDTVLLASRHLYRMPYSLHEKSGLVSIPIKTQHVLYFDKDEAKPENIVFDVDFLSRKHIDSSQTAQLIQQALGQDFAITHIHADIEKKSVLIPEVPLPETAISEEFFPPCLQLLAQGMEDGKKRALFVMINFLRVSGWDVQAIEKYVYDWNSRNPEPLREQYLKGQLSQIKRSKKPLPPPNCDNADYYRSLLVCKPDGLCNRIKNPAMYAKRKQEFAAKRKPAKTVKKTKKSSDKDATDQI